MCFNGLPYLQDLLVFLGLRVVNLLNGLDVVFEVSDGVLPCSETLDKDTGGLVKKRVSDICGEKCARSSEGLGGVRSWDRTRGWPSRRWRCFAS